MLIDLFESNARFLYRKSHIPDAPYSYIKETTLRDVVVTSSAAGPSSQEERPSVIDPVDDRKSVFIEKFEDIGMVDPVTGAGHRSVGALGGKGKSPAAPGSKKKDHHGHKPSLKSIEFTKFIYPDCKMDNPQRPPNMIYLPTPEVMRKMIKACIKVETP